MTGRLQKFFLVLLALMLVGIVLAGLVVSQAFKAWVAASRAGNEAAVVQHLKTIAVVEANYFYSHNRTFGTLEQLTKEQMMSGKFAGNPVTIDGYVFTLTVTSEQAAYTLTADPASKAEGTNHFYLDSLSHQIHVNREKPAGPNDPLLDK